MKKKYEHFGIYLKNLRSNKGLSVTKLAQLSNVSAAYISRVENGTRQTPQPDILKKLAPHLGLKYIELMVEAGYLTENSENLIIDDQNTKELYVSLTEQKKELLRIVDDLSEKTIDLIAQVIKEIRKNMGQ